MKLAVPEAPNTDVSRLDALRELWTGAGLTDIETREISVTRTFADFDDYWATVQGAPSMGPVLAAMPAADVARLKTRMRAVLAPADTGRVTCRARANAVKGRAP
jgi:hypothetical protein